MRGMSSEKLKLWKGAWEAGVSPGNSLESPTQCAEEAETVAGAAVPRCAPCAVGGRLGTSMGKNRLPTYHLSPLWSETKQLREFGIP